MPIPKNYNYKPLPDGVALGPSSVHGHGVFAVVGFDKEGYGIGISHIRVNDMPDPLPLIRTPLGGFLNHSDDPNCRLKNTKISGVDIYMLITTRDIDPGEELTLDYSNEVCGNPFGAKDTDDEEK